MSSIQQNDPWWRNVPRDQWQAAVDAQQERMQTSPGAKWVDALVTAQWQIGFPKRRPLGALKVQQ